jgi:hypothetical protein
MPRKWSTKRKETLEEGLNSLLGELCVLSGYCNDLNGSKLVQDFPVLTADDFARSVLVAEGMNPEIASDYKMIRERFRLRYGASVSKLDYEAGR